MAKALAPCPFCASLKVEVWEIEVEQVSGGYRKNWRVICKQCGAQGPWGGPGENGKYAALERWNAARKELGT